MNPNSNPWDSDVSENDKEPQIGIMPSASALPPIIQSSSRDSLASLSGNHSIPSSSFRDSITMSHHVPSSDPWTVDSPPTATPSFSNFISNSYTNMEIPQNNFSSTVPPQSSLSHDSNVPRLSYYATKDKIKITLSSESVSLFGHQNYVVESELINTRVIRRYSDFVWLQQLLLTRYPFRVVVSLPPKKAVGATITFIERRRKGLARFMDFVANHPVLSKDEQVIGFLTTDLSIIEYKNRNQFLQDDEFLTAQITEEIVNAVPEEFDQHLLNFMGHLNFQLNSICEVLRITDKLLSLSSAASYNYLMLGKFLVQASRRNSCILPDCSHCLEFEDECDQVSEGLSSVAKAMEEQCISAEGDLFESLKLYRDALAGFQALLARRSQCIPQLSTVPTNKRLATNRTKLTEAISRGSNRAELDRINGTINQDEREIEYQEAKLKFIRYCIWQEFDYLHSQKNLVKRCIKACAQSQTFFTSLNLENWALLISLFQ